MSDTYRRSRAMKQALLLTSMPTADKASRKHRNTQYAMICGLVCLYQRR